MEKIITYAYMRAETDISQHVPDSRLDNPIKWAQERLKGLLGSGFYADFYAAVVGNIMTTPYTDLLDPYVKQYLAWQAHELWLPGANVFSSGTGVRTFTEENSDVATDKTMSELIGFTKQQTQFYKGNLLTFLKDNRGNYPLYTLNTCGTNNTMGAQFHITRIGGRKKC